MYSTLVVQDGPTGEVGVNGDQIEDILEFVIGKLREFNKPPYRAQETTLAIQDCESALYWLHRRTARRLRRGVEGTSKP